MSHHSINHHNENFSLPPGGGDTDKQNSTVQLACVYLSLCHLTANHRTKGGEIYYVVFMVTYPINDLKGYFPLHTSFYDK